MYKNQGGRTRDWQEPAVLVEGRCEPCEPMSTAVSLETRDVTKSRGCRSGGTTMPFTPTSRRPSPIYFVENRLRLWPVDGAWQGARVKCLCRVRCL